MLLNIPMMTALFDTHVSQSRAAYAGIAVKLAVSQTLFSEDNGSLVREKPSGINKEIFQIHCKTS